MHRAGVDSAPRDRLDFLFFFGKILLRIGSELCFAAGRTEIIGVAAILGVVLGGVRIDRHTADRVENAALGRLGVIVRVRRWCGRG